MRAVSYMSASATEASGPSVPEYLTWEELGRLPEHIAEDIELWERRVIWNRRPPFEHQEIAVLMRNAMKSEAQRAMRSTTGEDEEQCWQVGTETNVFFSADKSSFLTPDFLVRRCQPRGTNTMAADVVLAGEVLSGSDTHDSRLWKMGRYAEGGIPWYWEVELDLAGSWDITAVRAYELAVIPAVGLAVKPLRPAMYVPVGEWRPTDVAIDFPEPFDMHISWDDLAF